LLQNACGALAVASDARSVQVETLQAELAAERKMVESLRAEIKELKGQVGQDRDLRTETEVVNSRLQEDAAQLSCELGALAATLAENMAVFKTQREATEGALRLSGIVDKGTRRAISTAFERAQQTLRVVYQYASFIKASFEDHRASSCTSSATDLMMMKKKGDTTTNNNNNPPRGVRWDPFRMANKARSHGTMDTSPCGCGCTTCKCGLGTRGGTGGGGGGGAPTRCSNRPATAPGRGIPSRAPSGTVHPGDNKEPWIPPPCLTSLGGEQLSMLAALTGTGTLGVPTLDASSTRTAPDEGGGGGGGD